MLLLRSSNHDDAVKAMIDKLYMQESTEETPAFSEEARQAILRSILDTDKVPGTTPHVKGFSWKRIAVAASALLIFSVAASMAQ